jgi:hypothetical protein
MEASKQVLLRPYLKRSNTDKRVAWVSISHALQCSNNSTTLLWNEGSSLGRCEGALEQGDSQRARFSLRHGYHVAHECIVEMHFEHYCNCFKLGHAPMVRLSHSFVCPARFPQGLVARAHCLQNIAWRNSFTLGGKCSFVCSPKEISCVCANFVLCERTLGELPLFRLGPRPHPFPLTPPHLPSFFLSVGVRHRFVYPVFGTWFF